MSGRNRHIKKWKSIQSLEEAINMWDNGYGTAEIAKKLNVEEFMVYNFLAACREQAHQNLKDPAQTDHETRPIQGESYNANSTVVTDAKRR